MNITKALTVVLTLSVMLFAFSGCTAVLLILGANYFLGEPTEPTVPTVPTEPSMPTAPTNPTEPTEPEITAPEATDAPLLFTTIMRRSYEKA